MGEGQGADQFRSRDLYFSAYLMACGLELKGVEKSSSPGLSNFVFDDFEKCQELKLNWTNGKAPIEATIYAEKIIKLKKICHRGN